MKHFETPVVIKESEDLMNLDLTTLMNLEVTSVSKKEQQAFTVAAAKPVMVDRRIVYTPNFAGVYWDTVDLPPGNIERIEVIRLRGTCPDCRLPKKS